MVLIVYNSFMVCKVIEDIKRCPIDFYYRPFITLEFEGANTPLILDFAFHSPDNRQTHRTTDKHPGILV